MTLYTVTWEIALDADTPLEAAAKAREIQSRTYGDSLATVFVVKRHGQPNSAVEQIDLLDGQFEGED